METKIDGLTSLLQLGPDSHDRWLERIEDDSQRLHERISRLEAAREQEQQQSTLDKRLIAYDALKWVLGLAVAAAIGAWISGQIQATPAPSNTITIPADAGTTSPMGEEQP
ncbi:MAG: hypothetical protein AAFS10_04910 [Myxococcota bacterium]